MVVWGGGGNGYMTGTFIRMIGDNETYTSLEHIVTKGCKAKETFRIRIVKEQRGRGGDYYY